MNCKSCKYWGLYNHYLDYNHVRICNKTVQLFDAEEWKDDDDAVIRVIKPEYKDQMMFTQDSSSYCASLYTREDFLCSHYESNQ